MPDITDTPPEDGGINDLHRRMDPHGFILRHEFDDLREDVRDIKRALVGKNLMKPDHDSIVARVDDHEKAVREARWGYRLTAATVIAMALRSIFGGH